MCLKKLPEQAGVDTSVSSESGQQVDPVPGEAPSDHTALLACLDLSYDILFLLPWDHSHLEASGQALPFPGTHRDPLPPLPLTAAPSDLPGGSCSPCSRPLRASLPGAITSHLAQVLVPARLHLQT